MSLAALAPVSTLAHEGAVDTVQGHIQEDSVATTPREERRFERRTDAATASDAEAAAQAVSGDVSQVGQWGPVVDWPVVGIHVALLANGKVLAYDSSADSLSDPDHTFTRATVWDPATGVHTPANATTGVNLFCSGLAHLADGTLFTAGGNKNPALEGIADTHVFNSDTNTWTRENDMAYERWYPSVTPLSNGEMLITEGGPDLPEVRETDGDIRVLANAPLDGERIYLWIDVAPDGRAYYTGPAQNMRSLDPSGGGSWQFEGMRDSEYRGYGSRAVYDDGKILATGGNESGGAPSGSAVTIDLNGPTPQVSNTAPMASPRKQHNLTVLADGTVLATGGNSSGADLVDLDNGVYEAELWSPDTGQWRTLASMQATRQYHSTALLLPDGRVLSSGGGICGGCEDVGYLEKNAEVFSPPYLFKNDGSGQLAPRPLVTNAPDVVAYDAPFSITTPNAGSISEVALARLGAVTHSVDMEQRYVPLDFTAGSGTITATAPPNGNIAPPGVYMLFVVGTDGVPSVAKMVRVDETAPPPSTPTITATSPASLAKDNEPEVRGSGAETGSTVRIYGDASCTGAVLGTGTAVAFNGSTGITATVPADATANLAATATDVAGRASPCSAPLAYTEDSTAPDTAAEVAIDGGTARATFSSEPSATFECELDGGGLVSCRSPMVFTDLTVGDHSFEVRATDSTGNADATPARKTFAIADTTPPETQIVKGPKRSGTKRKARFRFQASEPNSKFTCSLDGKAKRCGAVLSMKVRRGAHRLTVAASDADGNIDSSPATYSWRVMRPKR